MNDALKMLHSHVNRVEVASMALHKLLEYGSGDEGGSSNESTLTIVKNCWKTMPTEIASLFILKFVTYMTHMNSAVENTAKFIGYGASLKAMSLP